jgi:sterol desaturase/sphingolipid hydroxylase (fatty acid hydroxylase superfamily)
MWGAFFAAALGAVYVGIGLGYSGDVSLGLVTFAAGASLVVIERIWPQQPAWVAADEEWWHDIGHFVFGFALGSFGATWLAQVVVATPVLVVWPVQWPLLAQVVLGLVVAEFFIYWQHRVLHSVPALWPLHALHHDTGRMTFFKTTRIHALDIGSATFLSLAPLLALGAPLPVLLWVTAFGNFTAQMQHANVRMPTPAWLNRVVGTPAVHWLHHSLDKHEGNSNFGMNLMVWDLVFGTYIPPAPTPCTTLGIEPQIVPTTFLGQLALPLRMARDAFRRS